MKPAEGAGPPSLPRGHSDTVLQANHPNVVQGGTTKPPRGPRARMESINSRCGIPVPRDSGAASCVRFKARSRSRSASNYLGHGSHNPNVSLCTLAVLLLVYSLSYHTTWRKDDKKCVLRTRSTIECGGENRTKVSDLVVLVAKRLSVMPPFSLTPSLFFFYGACCGDPNAGVESRVLLVLHSPFLPTK